MASNQEKLDRIFFEETEKFPSRSKYRNKENPFRDTIVGYVLQLDAYAHEAETEERARKGDKEALALVKREADAGDKAAQAVLDEIKKV